MCGEDPVSRARPSLRRDCTVEACPALDPAPASFTMQTFRSSGATNMGKQHSAGLLKVVNGAKSRVKECTVADVKQKLDRGETFHLVDVREESEWAGGHLPRAEHLGKGIIERDIEARIPDHD